MSISSLNPSRTIGKSLLIGAVLLTGSLMLYSQPEAPNKPKEKSHPEQPLPVERVPVQADPTLLDPLEQLDQKNVAIPLPPGVDLQPIPAAPFELANPNIGTLTFIVPRPFNQRSRANRQKVLAQMGGNAQSEACVARGLAWLAAHQASDGRWSLNEFNKHARRQPFPEGKPFTCDCEPGTSFQNDVAATAMALLPFLGAGHTHNPAKGKPDYSKTVRAGLMFLIRRQDAKGVFDRNMYAHGLATMAVCEAYGMTQDPVVRRSGQLAVNYLARAQDPAGGGWRYSPRQPGDLSVTGWQVQALIIAKLAGLDVPKATLAGAEKFVDSCQTPTSTFSYMPAGGTTLPMTAAGLLCAHYLGIDHAKPSFVKGLAHLEQQGLAGERNLYTEYYGTQVMFNVGGKQWTLWNEGSKETGQVGLRDMLIKDMVADPRGKKPHEVGSWRPAPGATTQGGRIMSTALSLLILEAYYRYPQVVVQKLQDR